MTPSQETTNLIEEMRAQIEHLTAAVRKLQDPRGRLFLATVADDDTFTEVAPDGADDFFDVDGGRVVSDTSDADLLARDPTTADGDDVTALLAYKAGPKTYYVKIGGVGGGTDMVYVLVTGTHTGVPNYVGKVLDGLPGLVAGTPGLFDADSDSSSGQFWVDVGDDVVIVNTLEFGNSTGTHWLAPGTNPNVFLAFPMQTVNTDGDAVTVYMIEALQPEVKDCSA